MAGASFRMPVEQQAVVAAYGVVGKVAAALVQLPVRQRRVAARRDHHDGRHGRPAPGRHAFDKS